MRPPPEWKQARELAASPDSYDQDGRMLPEVVARIDELADQMGGADRGNVHPLHPRLAAP